jgi:hypothetical protein
VVGLEGTLPWLEGIYIMVSEGPSRVEPVIEKAIKGSEAGEGVVDKIVRKRHLAGDGW